MIPASHAIRRAVAGVSRVPSAVVPEHARRAGAGLQVGQGHGEHQVGLGAAGAHPGQRRRHRPRIEPPIAAVTASWCPVWSFLVSSIALWSVAGPLRAAGHCRVMVNRRVLGRVPSRGAARSGTVRIGLRRVRRSRIRPRRLGTARPGGGGIRLDVVAAASPAAASVHGVVVHAGVGRLAPAHLVGVVIAGVLRSSVAGRCLASSAGCLLGGCLLAIRRARCSAGDHPSWCRCSCPRPAGRSGAARRVRRRWPSRTPAGTLRSAPARGVGWCCADRAPGRCASAPTTARSPPPGSPWLPRRRAARSPTPRPHHRPPAGTTRPPGRPAARRVPDRPGRRTRPATDPAVGAPPAARARHPMSISPSSTASRASGITCSRSRRYSLNTTIPVPTASAPGDHRVAHRRGLPGTGPLDEFRDLPGTTGRQRRGIRRDPRRRRRALRPGDLTARQRLRRHRHPARRGEPGHPIQLTQHVAQVGPAGLPQQPSQPGQRRGSIHQDLPALRQRPVDHLNRVVTGRRHGLLLFHTGNARPHHRQRSPAKPHQQRHIDNESITSTKPLTIPVCEPANAGECSAAHPRARRQHRHPQEAAGRSA